MPLIIVSLKPGSNDNNHAYSQWENNKAITDIISVRRREGIWTDALWHMMLVCVMGITDVISGRHVYLWYTDAQTKNSVYAHPRR